jgi:malonyl CoA-acyl carrier protein transacylase
MAMLAFVFPGQGAQKRGMGQKLFDTVKEFTAVEAEVDAILGYSMRKLCLEDPNNQLVQTQFTQPALYVVNALHYYEARAEGARPQFVAGHSVGEYDALLAAGAFDFLTGLRLVKKRGELMAQARDGGMAAVIGLDAERVARVLREENLNALDVANFNAPAQTVISGPLDDVKRAAAAFEKAGAKLYMPLPVSAAFHSRYMAPAAKEFGAFLASFHFRPLQIPVIANLTGQPYPDGDPTTAIRSILEQQITGSVQWTESVRYLLRRGVTSFREVGPAVVLTRLIQQIQEAETAAAIR